MRQLFLAPILGIALALPAAAQPGPGFARLEVTVPGYPDGGEIPVEFSQAAPDAEPGGGTSPEITWAGAPGGTESFVVHFHDMNFVREATTEDQLHWLVWNIPGDSTGLPEGVESGNPLPNGSLQTSATGEVYRGPGAPAEGPFHHYVFEIYALDTVLDIEPQDDAFATRAEVLEAIQGHVIGKGVYTGLFKRPAE